MKIQPKLTTLTFAEAEHGAVLLTTMGQHKLVQGMKAYHIDEDGSRGEFFVTIGPFYEEHGDRPVVYYPKDLGDGSAVDVSDWTRLSWDLNPENVTVKSPDTTHGHAVWGELICVGGSTLMTAANFNRAGHLPEAYLDLETGAVGALPDAQQYFVVSKWRIEALDDEGHATTVMEFETSDE